MVKPLDELTNIFKGLENPKKALGRYQIAEVISFNSDPRQITINMLGFNISKNISIAQHLLSGYTREFDLTGNINNIELSLTENNINPVSSVNLPYESASKPTPYFVEGEGTLKGSGTYQTTGTINWKTDSLQAGDYVKVLISEDEKKFFIIDRFESWV